MAFKLKGFPKHGTKAYKKIVKETGYIPEERDDVSKKFRHDVKTQEYGSGKTQEVHTFARGGRYDTKPHISTKSGTAEFVDKDGDGVVDQQDTGEGLKERGRTVSIGKQVGADGDITYMRDAKRWKKGAGDHEGKTGIFKPREISEDRYNRIMRRKMAKQECKDAKHERQVSKAEVKATKKAARDARKAEKETAKKIKKGNKQLRKGPGTFDESTGIYTGPSGMQVR